MEEQCDQLTVEKNQLQLMLDSADEVQRAIKEDLDKTEGRIEQLRMQLAERDRALAAQGSLSTVTEEPRAVLHRSRVNWTWEVPHEFPAVRGMEKSARKDLAQNTSIMYAKLGETLKTAGEDWLAQQRERNVSEPDRYPSAECHARAVDAAFNQLMTFKINLLYHGRAQNPDGMLSASKDVCGTKRVVTEAKLEWERNPTAPSMPAALTINPGAPDIVR